MNSLRLTEKQQSELDRQIAARPSDRRVGVPLTNEQAEAYENAIQEEHAGKEELVARVRQLRAAEQEAGLFGDLRRAINSSRIPKDQIASQIGVSSAALDDFRTGAALLSPEHLNELASLLRLRLMQEIPARHEQIESEQVH